MNKLNLEDKLTNVNAAIAKIEADAGNVQNQITQLQETYNILSRQHNQATGQRDLLVQLIADEKKIEETPEAPPVKIPADTDK
jgi:septal ring factor EnvC (AmiA/AmiB activator)